MIEAVKAEGNQQLAVAHHTFDTQQDIIRHLDTKAGVFIVLIVFLLTGLLPIVKDVAIHLVWHGKGAHTSWLYLLSGGGAVAAFLVTVWCVHNVIRPRGSSYRGLSCKYSFAEGPLDDEVDDNLDPNDLAPHDNALLRDLIVQIQQLRSILKEKTDALEIAKWPIFACFGCWAINIIVSVYILTWK